MYLLAKGVPAKQTTGTMALAMAPWMGKAASEAMVPATSARLVGFFAKAGAMVFGSGLAIVPFLYGGGVRGYHLCTGTHFFG